MVAAFLCAVSRTYAQEIVEARTGELLFMGTPADNQTQPTDKGHFREHCFGRRRLACSHI
jgi:hypothetical protein